MLRLDRYLAEAGAGSRSEVKKAVSSGLVTVDGAVVRDYSRKVDPSANRICHRGIPVVRDTSVCYLFYKPAGCVTARRDRSDRTVMDYFPEALRDRLSPVGRLDKDTEGLLLVTDDGALNHRLTSPAHHVEKTYYAVLDAPLPGDAVDRFYRGLDIGDEKPARPAVLALCEPDAAAACRGVCQALVTVTEGRYHQVKRMFAAVGCTVVFLKRTAFAGLTLEGLSPGEYRKLQSDELERLRSRKRTGEQKSL